ncbi:MAG: hypothetical protein ABI400_11850 [Lacisediminihabitans sp.]
MTAACTGRSFASTGGTVGAAGDLFGAASVAATLPDAGRVIPSAVGTPTVEAALLATVAATKTGAAAVATAAASGVAVLAGVCTASCGVAVEAGVVIAGVVTDAALVGTAEPEGIVALAGTVGALIADAAAVTLVVGAVSELAVAAVGAGGCRSTVCMGRVVFATTGSADGLVVTCVWGDRGVVSMSAVSDCWLFAALFFGVEPVADGDDAACLSLAGAALLFSPFPCCSVGACCEVLAALLSVCALNACCIAVPKALWPGELLPWPDAAGRSRAPTVESRKLLMLTVGFLPGRRAK